MIESIIGALLPIVVTLLLGMMAGWHHDFDAKQAGILNRMVMLYALPLSLFAGMVGTSRDAVIAQWPLALMILFGMMGSYFLVFGVAIVLRLGQARAALLALAIGGPAVPFVGVSVLGHLFGDQSAIAIAICGLVMNLLQVPISLIALSGAAPTGDGARKAPGQLVLDALREPVVWAPMLALLIILIGWRLPASIRDSLALLGRSTGGVALFASGIVLFSHRVAVSTSVVVATLARNIAVPLIVWGVALLFLTPTIREEAVVTMAIPTASIATILAVQYHTAEQEMASILFFSTIFSVLTMGGFMWLTAR
ncbi:transporter [Neoasaia chiangmaiensis NBRC 101099]|uniref:Permease n=1 Tax=Neoasaia chiangmaiensis TaxID=320497 RepID=A0A1U9KNR4_9PROT|nr:AEC family transporter [Neoasaia chiangmaiensis]AQS87434.1 permease [Neoasaia chiangmaiensis]GBR42734.1 transporter [Neoasaia chiangmaiensis NBRC 101099]GEN16210.1 receptor protein [Neoasaia chiangmaiensis]